MPPPPGSRGGFPNARPDARERYVSPAHDNGYRDGLEAGERAARNGNRSDPIREKRYRDGDHDYESRYGSRDAYNANIARASSKAIWMDIDAFADDTEWNRSCHSWRCTSLSMSLERTSASTTKKPRAGARGCCREEID
ncbi:MAG: hypothetical protein QM736_16030 [Vicinamibacterales bacterium]